MSALLFVLLLCSVFLNCWQFWEYRLLKAQKRAGDWAAKVARELYYERNHEVRRKVDDITFGQLKE